MYTVKQKTVFTKPIKDGSIQTCYLMHITVDTIAEIPDAKENWIAGSRCDVLEDGGHVYLLSNGREWIEVNFFDRVSEGDSTDLSNYYTKSQTDERITEEILDHLNNVGQFYFIHDKIKGEIFNNYDKNVASGLDSHAEGSGTTASGSYSHSEGSSTKASESSAHSEGSCTTASGIDSHAEGYYSQAFGSYSHAEGRDTQASGNSSHAEGYSTEATGSYSHAEGNFTEATKEASHAEGKGSQAYGICSHAEGYYSQASGPYSHAEGHSTQASGSYSHVEGYNTKAYGDYSHVAGKYNKIDYDNEYAFIIGNGTADSIRSNAFAIDWNGNIYVNNSSTPVNVLDLLNRLSVLESKIAELENSENT